MDLIKKDLNKIQNKPETKLIKRFSVTELKSLSKEQRENILRQQTEIAILDYEVIPDGFDIIEA